MKFFIDTANLAEIKEANDLGILDGVTTNPSLMAKEGISGDQNVLDHYVAICNIVDGPVSAEVGRTACNTRVGCVIDTVQNGAGVRKIPNSRPFERSNNRIFERSTS